MPKSRPNKSKHADLVKLSPFSLVQKKAANFTRPAFEALKFEIYLWGTKKI